MTAIEFRRLSKSFGPAQVLTDVSMKIEPGEIHALIGENGAGKSTLVKIVSGTVSADAGAVSIDGAEIKLSSSRDAARAGVATAFQELSLLPNLTVGENLLMPDLPRGRIGLITAGGVRRRANQILEEWNLPLSPGALVEGLSLASKQRLEIVKAFSRSPRLLILDEPTAALADVEWLFQHMRHVAAAGTAILYISHRFHEIQAICDGGTVLRNGKVVGSFERETFDGERLLQQMIGRSFETVFPARGGEVSDEVGLRVRDLSVSESLKDVNLDVRKGEIVGVSALDGQGQRELFYSLYGLRKTTSGTVEVDGKEVSVRSPRAALRAGSGLALVPEERKTEGLFLGLSGRENLMMPVLSSVARGGLISTPREWKKATDEAARVNLDPAVLGRRVGQLSGGNQQKVVFGKTLLTGASCLLLFDPARGIDAATKLEIYDLIRQLAASGGAILLYSTEIPELVGLCDRVVTLHGRRINGEFEGDEVTEANIMRSIFGDTSNGEAL